jgi:hypothetical protein
MGFAIFAFQKMGPAMFPAGLVAVTYMLMLTACAYDDKSKADIMLNSLPIKRSKIVLAKYLSIFIFAALGTIAYLLSVNLIRILEIPIQTTSITLGGMLGGLFAIALLNSIYFPVYFKVGYIKSRIVNFVLFFAFFFGVTSVVNFLYDSREKIWLKKLTFSVKQMTDLQIAGFLIAIILLILFISYLLSLRFYKSREF